MSIIQPPTPDFTGWCPCGCGEYWVDGQDAPPPSVWCPVDLEDCPGFDCNTQQRCSLMVAAGLDGALRRPGT